MSVPLPKLLKVKRWNCHCISWFVIGKPGWWVAYPDCNIIQFYCFVFNYCSDLKLWQSQLKEYFHGFFKHMFEGKTIKLPHPLYLIIQRVIYTESGGGPSSQILPSYFQWIIPQCWMGHLISSSGQDVTLCYSSWKISRGQALFNPYAAGGYFGQYKIIQKT